MSQPPKQTEKKTETLDTQSLEKLIAEKQQLETMKKEMQERRKKIKELQASSKSLRKHENKRKFEMGGAVNEALKNDGLELLRLNEEQYNGVLETLRNLKIKVKMV